MPVQPPTKSPSGVPDKPAKTFEKTTPKKFDPFHPDMPQIPGLPIGRARSSQGGDARRIILIGAIATVAVLAGVLIFRRMKSTPHPVQSASQNATIPEPPVPELTPPDGIPVHAGPVVAATAEELSKPWAAKGFNFVNPLTQENVEAMVIRLPGGGLWAFALKEPYGECKLEFVTDLTRLAKQYGYHASHPMVANPCNSTIYDPLKVGSMGSGEWIRGEIVQGGGLRPPISINVQVSGHSIIADRME